MGEIVILRASGVAFGRGLPRLFAKMEAAFASEVTIWVHRLAQDPLCARQPRRMRGILEVRGFPDMENMIFAICFVNYKGIQNLIGLRQAPEDRGSDTR